MTIERRPTPFKAIADNAGFSERLVRDAFHGKPVTYQTACRLGKAVHIAVEFFRIKEDRRGQRDPVIAWKRRQERSIPKVP
jgi:hypothetical protein